MGSVEVLYGSEECLCEIMIKFFCVVIVVALIACDHSHKPDVSVQKPDISGHWVSVPNDGNGSYWTIDIIDSLLIADRGSLLPYGDTFLLSEIHLDSLPYFDAKKGLTRLFDVYWPGENAPKWNYDTIAQVFGDTIAYNHDDEMISFNPDIADPDAIEPYIDIMRYVVALRNDTLIVNAEHTLGGGHFIRGKPDFEADLFSDLYVDIELVRYQGTNCEQKSKSNYAWISIGKSRSPLFGDTSKIQANDVFIEIAGVPHYLEVEKHKFELSEREKLVAALAIDRNTPEEFLMEVLETIREYDRDIQLTFPVINRHEEKVCFLDSAAYFSLMRESNR